MQTPLRAIADLLQECPAIAKRRPLQALRRKAVASPALAASR
jgi:hypothetical protein